MLKRTRFSLMYVATYLSIIGLGWFLFPQITLRLFFSNGHYDSIFVRVAGAFIIVLSIFIIQVIRYSLEVMYKTIIFVRLFLLAVWIILYSITKDPLFISALVVVGIGVLFSIFGMLTDKKLL